MKTVDFYFDLSSPYSYLAATQIDAIATKHGATVAWKPMVLGAVFKATGNVMPAQVAAKAKWMFSDLDHWSKHYGVPLKFTSHFPLNTIKPERLVIVADGHGKASQLALAAFRALWVDDIDITQEAAMRDLCKAAGLDPDQSLAAIETPPIKDRLRHNTDEAIARGVFGAPAIIVGDQLFWGNDRLHFVDKLLSER
jgi:2-hydroxychromene-2-carboxylate isomerase